MAHKRFIHKSFACSECGERMEYSDHRGYYCDNEECETYRELDEYEKRGLK